MKKLMYAIALGLAFVSITSANQVIASSPSGLLTILPPFGKSIQFLKVGSY